MLGEPFLLLGEIENYLRQLIEPRFNIDQIRAAKNPGDQSRVIDGVDDLSFGEYIRLLENDANWSVLKLPLERSLAIADLKLIRDLRNDVMHFDTDGPDEDQLCLLRRWSVLFQKLATLDVL